jgi:ABC-2 type transport system ATP-binding protein
VPGSTIAIEATGLVKHFGDVRALDGFDMHVERGEVRALVGPNGAGKTTLLRVMFGLVAPDEGSIRMLGSEWTPLGSGNLKGVAGFVEDPRLHPYLSARRNLLLLARMDGVAPSRVDEVLRVVRLTDRAGHRVGSLSSGMRQRLGLAAALLRSPSVLLLDEPTVGLDPVGAKQVQHLLRALAAGGVTVLLSSHNMTELEGVCDSVTVMRSGRSVWEGSMARLRQEAPAPAHRLWTTDDGRALDVARADPRVRVVADPEGWLTVSAEPPDLERFVLSLGHADVAVRRLEPLMGALESMFLALTGSREERIQQQAVADADDGRVEAVR